MVGIEIQGLIGNVMPVTDLIYQELRAFDRRVHEKKHAKLLTNFAQVYSVIRRDLIAGRLNKYFTLSKVFCCRFFRMTVQL